MKKLFKIILKAYLWVQLFVILSLIDACVFGHYGDQAPSMEEQLRMGCSRNLADYACPSPIAGSSGSSQAPAAR